MIEAMQQQQRHMQQQHDYRTRQEVELESSLATQHDCDHCGEKFDSNAALRDHQNTKHQGARAWTCPECGKSFATSSGLKQHQHIHSSVKPFQCEVCLKAYTQFSNLCRHKRMHADCRQQIKCHECGQSFSTLHSLNKHKRFCEGVMRSGARINLPPPTGNGIGLQGSMNGLVSPPTAAALSPFGSPPPSSITNPHLAALQAAYLNMYTSGTNMPMYPSMGPSMHGMYPGYSAGITKTTASAFSSPWKDNILRKPDDSENSDINSISEESLPESEPTSPKSEVAPSPVKETSNDEVSPDTPTSSFHHSKSSPFAEAKPSHQIEDILKISSNVTPIFNYSAMKRKQEMRNSMSLATIVDKIKSEEHAEEKKEVDDEHSSMETEVKKEDLIEKEETTEDEPASQLPPKRSDSPKSSEAPLDLTVKCKDIKEESDDSRKTHIFGGGSKIMKVSPMPIPAPKPLTPHKKVEVVSPEKKIAEPEAIRPHQLHSAYPVPNPMFMNHMYGMDRDKLSQMYGFDREKLQAYQNMANMASMMSIGHRNGMYPTMNPAMPSSPLEASPRVLPPYMDSPRSHHSHGHTPYQSFNPGYTRTKDKYVCKFCGKNFPRSANLTRHLRTHTGEQPYKCKYCERSFSISSNLQRHIRNIHNKEKPYQCQLCERSFGQQTNLDRHMKSHEPEPLPTMVRPSEDFRYSFGSIDRQSSLADRFPFANITKELDIGHEENRENEDEDDVMDDGFPSESPEELNGCNADDESSDDEPDIKDTSADNTSHLSMDQSKEINSAMDVNFSITAQIGKQKAMDIDKPAELVLSH